MSRPRASIILPTLDGEAHLRRLLPALARQELAGGFELLAVDSSSDDATRELLREAGADLLVIERADFRHGPTRNLRAAGARGEFLVFLSQDVEPTEPTFLEALLGAFEDPRVAGAYSRVLPRPDDDPLTRRTCLGLPEASAEPVVRDLDHVASVRDLTPEQRADYLRFNNVASAIRHSVFREIPFPDLAFGEDFGWAARALDAGWRIRFVPESVVWHAHAYSPREVFERYRVDAEFHRQTHGHRVRPTALSAARGFLFEVRADLRFLAQGDGGRRESVGGYLRHAALSPWLRGAQVLGQYCGSHGWARGRDERVAGRML